MRSDAPSAAPAIWRPLAWLVATAAMLNTLYFALRVTSPVMQSDAWYFLEAFLRKAIAGNLEFADFFVKRAGADHAQPLFKLALWFEWRFFDLDFKVEALIGLAAAVGCALVLHRLVCGEPRESSRAVRCIAWSSMCVMLFTLNADASVWTWSLVALEYLALLAVLAYFIAAWHAALRSNSLMLGLATLAICIACDDLGEIAALAVTLVMTLDRARDGTRRNRGLLNSLGMLFAGLLLARIFYAFMPIVGVTKAGPLWSSVGLLPQRFLQGGWWKWIVLPLAFPFFHESWLTPAQTHAWSIIRWFVAAALVWAHMAFWRRASRGHFKLGMFVAVCLMVFGYGQMAGILLGRVAAHGNDYFEQPRYMIRFAEMPLALLLMWASSGRAQLRAAPCRPNFAGPAFGCLLLLGIQLPLSVHAWKMRPYLLAYQAKMASQIHELARNPAASVQCLPELTFCSMPAEKRRELTRLLSDNDLNVFSARVQQRYRYLPRWLPLQQSPEKSRTR